MTKRTNKLTYIIAVILAAVIAITIFFSAGGGAFNASAASATAYTNALTDLTADKNFSTADYPVNNTDRSLSVIQIAESDDNELFVYVYQPCISFSDMYATSINMSLTDSAKDAHLYKLVLLNRGGTLGKYKVDGITVGNDDRRIYNITSIYRPFNKLIDAAAGNDNTVSEVSYPVGQKWAAVTTANGVVYSMTETEVIVITDKFVSSVHYEGGVPWFGGKEACDSHFVAFSTNKEIERLISAKVAWITKTWNKATSVSDITYGDPVPHEDTLTYKDVATTKLNGIIKRKYSWDRIQRASEFADSVDFGDTDEGKENKRAIKNKQWVLSFYETKSEQGAGVTEWAVSWLWGVLKQWSGSGELVSDVTILELEFETDGEYYNLGVVDNKQTGSGIPVNQPAIDKKNKRNAIIAGLIIGGIVIIALLVLSIVYPVVGQVLITIFKGLWLVISAPFRAIVALIRTRQANKQAAATSSKSTPAASSKSGKKKKKHKGAKK